MGWIDISVGISPALPVWPGDPAIELERLASIEAGEEVNISRLASGVHIGTHVDAPKHFLDEGGTVEALSLEALIGPAEVVEISGSATIDAEALAGADIPGGCQRLLLKTSNSQLWSRIEAGFQKDFVAVDDSGAGWLVDHGLRLVGIDYLSIAPWGAAGPTHRTLLRAGVVILEGIDLRQVAPGSYQLVCLPLKLVGSDGAPARAVLESIE
ncbi:MAG TPA: cyclase family protein [Anaerolineales bacterium]|jgi:arylformamidase